MRNLFFYSAMVLAGAMAITSCSSDSDPIVENNPSFDGNAVKTQFAINVPAAGKAAQTRMSGTIVQEEGTTAGSTNFRGIDNIYLFPSSTAITASSSFNGVIHLDAISAFDNTDAQTSNAKGNYKVYNDVNIPVGTTNFLFYGEAEKVSMGLVGDDALKNGVIESKLADASVVTTAGLNFNLKGILGSTNVTSIQTALLKILNDVAAVANWKTTTDPSLSAAYAKYTDIKGASRSGASQGILNTLQEVYNVAKPIAKLEATPTSANVIIAAAICEEIETSFDATDGGDNGYTLAYASSVDANVADFPACVYLPEGSAQVTCTDGVFSYNTNSTTVGSAGIKMASITYPASLFYTVNTDLRATASAAEPTWPNTVEKWATDGSWTSDWDQTTVVATTRKIALKENINYAVAKLATTIKCNAATLNDNAEAAGYTAAKVIDVPTDGYTVTGILVGGQPDQVDWEFYPNSTFNATVYDKDIVSGMAAKAGTASVANYTLLCDNLASSGDQLNVNIAIELVNTGDEFYGVGGEKIAKGAKFYLVGALSLDGKTWGTVTPTKSAVRAFAQDFTTTLNLNVKSLANAYTTIPDLRSSNIALGLSVDLHWNPGITFDVDLN